MSHLEIEEPETDLSKINVDLRIPLHERERERRNGGWKPANGVICWNGI